MAFPKYPDYSEITGGNSDEITVSPNKTTPSLLASERGTQYTRRLETDANRNLYVHVAEDDTQAVAVSPLAAGSVATIPASTLTTIVTYTASGAKKVSRIGCSGTIYAKYQLFKNTVLIETRRSGPERSIDFDFTAMPLAMADTDILDVKVTHFFTGHTEDFDATIYGA